MKESNKNALVQCINTILNSEFSEMKEEKEKLQIKYEELKKEIQTLKKEIQKEQWKLYEYANYKAFYYTFHSICPQCDWHWWFEDWQWWWEECDLCCGNWEIKIEDAREFLITNINKK